MWCPPEDDDDDDFSDVDVDEDDDDDDHDSDDGYDQVGDIKEVGKPGGCAHLRRMIC